MHKLYVDIGVSGILFDKLTARSHVLTHKHREYTVTGSGIADVYLLALECLKLSILPVTAGLKKNIGLDTAATMQGAMRQLFSALLKTLTPPSAQNSSSGE